MRGVIKITKILYNFNKREYIGFHRASATGHADRGRLFLRTPGPVPLGLVLGPSTALYEPFLKHCTLTNKAVGTI